MASEILNRKYKREAENLQKFLNAFPEGHWTTEEAAFLLQLEKRVIRTMLQNLQASGYIIRGENERWMVKRKV